MQGKSKAKIADKGKAADKSVEKSKKEKTDDMADASIKSVAPPPSKEAGKNGREEAQVEALVLNIDSVHGLCKV